MDGLLNDKILKINHITILSQLSELSSLYGVDPIDPEPQERRGNFLVIIILLRLFNIQRMVQFNSHPQSSVFTINHTKS